jgi:hypothetical protein
MNQRELETLHRWFDSYVTTYNDIPEPGQQNIRLKIDHTRMVCTMMARLTAGEQMSDEESCLATAVALLHDVGRFPQYRRWGTFRDSISDNHARLAIEVIREQNVLQTVDATERLIIEEAVRFHNLLALPHNVKSPTDRYIKLIRDADKLDIWRVFVEHFAKPADVRPSAVTLGFPDLPEVSAICLEQILAQQVVRLDSVRTVNDFILLLLSWVFDLNFASSYRLLQVDGYCDMLSKLLPDDSATQAALRFVAGHIERQQSAVRVS